MSPRLAWRLTAARLRDQPLRIAVTVLAIALGVALSSSIWFVNAAALTEFNRATRLLAGESDLVVRGPRAGFDEVLFAKLARLPGVRIASPALELDVALAGGRAPLRVLGVDPFRAGALQPMLFGEIGGRLFEFLGDDGIYLSAAAAQALRVRPGGRIEALVGDRRQPLEVLGVLSESAYPQSVGLMDIATAQWRLGSLGRINRVDLRLATGAGSDSVRSAVLAAMPAGTSVDTPQFEAARAASITRSYRVNLNMLALVSLLTGAFLVFSTQALSVLRRRSALALLRALGLRRGELQALLTLEGAALGVLGASLGVLAGHLLAAALLSAFRGDFGNGAPAAADPASAFQPVAATVFFVIGVAVATLGAWLPAYEASRAAPARALKAGDAESPLVPLRRVGPGVALLVVGALLCLVPPLGGLPIAGYAAVAALLFGAVQLVPRIAGALLARAPRSGWLAFDLGLAQLRGSAGQATVSLAAVIVSFSLMVAMTVMVHSFRVSFDNWLGRVLPADLQLRASQGNDTTHLTVEQQQAVRAVVGVQRVEFRRSQSLWLDGVQSSVMLIARDFTPQTDPDIMPLVRAATRPLARPVWISEQLQDRAQLAPGDTLRLPLAGRSVEFAVAGVFRDYGRPTGSAMIARAEYIALTGDRAANDGSLWLRAGADAPRVAAAVRTAVAADAAYDLLQTTELRERSMRGFDRAFLVTYALEAIAVGIGLLGVAFAASSTALARRAEFGMLRHIGLRRRDVRALLASEGLATSVLAVLYGLLLGAALSLVLVYVINRQSFSWSIDLAVPWGLLALLSAGLIAAAAATAMLSGRAAAGPAALRAVREDW